MRGVQFTKGAAKRISATVKYVERGRVDLAPRQRAAPQILASEGIAFMSDVDVPAYGAMIRDSSYAQELGDSVIHLTQATELHPGPYYLNSSTAVTAGSVGKCNALDGTPRTASLFTDNISAAIVLSNLATYRELQLGIVPNTFTLGWGLPGFAFLGGVDETAETCLVCAAPTVSFWGRAYENWRRYDDGGGSGNYVMVNPLQTFVHSRRYDGDVGPSPEIQVHVLLPSSPNKSNDYPQHPTYIDYSSGVLVREPNVVFGDPVLCVPLPIMRSSSGTDVEWLWRAHGNYLDDPVGTVKFHVVGNSVPRGWGIMDGEQNAVENGGSGLVVVNSFVRAANSNSTSSVTWQGGVGSSYKYFNLRTIERLDNSAS